MSLNREFAISARVVARAAGNGVGGSAASDRVVETTAGDGEGFGLSRQTNRDASSGAGGRHRLDRGDLPIGGVVQVRRGRRQNDRVGPAATDDRVSSDKPDDRVGARAAVYQTVAETI